MRLTKEDVRHIALLARIKIDDDTESMRGQLSAILDYFEVLQQVDTDEVDPAGHLSGLGSVMRDDQSRESIPIDDVMANVPERKGNHIKVRAILE